MKIDKIIIIEEWLDFEYNLEEEVDINLVNKSFQSFNWTTKFYNYIN